MDSLKGRVGEMSLNCSLLSIIFILFGVLFKVSTLLLMEGAQLIFV